MSGGGRWATWKIILSLGPARCFFALLYIYNRHQSVRDGSDLEDIKLYVIDTTFSPPQTFIRDLDLMNHFRKFDTEPVHSGLEGMWRLRFQSDDYYFGEYFSQGSLKIANKCQVVSAELFFREDRLLFLLPNLADIDSNQRYVERPGWANDVCMLRSII